MNQIGITRDLLIWLEGHLDHPLSSGNVAAKAGYSEWHLQRMFRDIAGHAIGAYIRTRRLSKSAITLRLTTRPTLGIALQYRFDSQQTFTHVFKKQFVQTLVPYRRSSEWSTFGIYPPLRLGEFTMPECKSVTLEDTSLTGATQSYSYPLEQIFDFRHEMRYRLWHDLLGSSPTIPPVLYSLNGIHPGQDKDDEQEVSYTAALAQDQVDGYVLTGYPAVLQGGECVMFTCEGLGIGVQEFILTVYGTCMSMLNLTHRKGRDVERYYPAEGAEVGDRPVNPHCELLVLVRRQRCSSSNTGVPRCGMSPVVSTTQPDVSYGPFR